MGRILSIGEIDSIHPTVQGCQSHGVVVPCESPPLPLIPNLPGFGFILFGRITVAYAGYCQNTTAEGSRRVEFFGSHLMLLNSSFGESPDVGEFSLVAGDVTCNSTSLPSGLGDYSVGAGEPVAHNVVSVLGDFEVSEGYGFTGVDFAISFPEGGEDASRPFGLEGALLAPPAGVVVSEGVGSWCISFSGAVGGADVEARFEGTFLLAE